MSFKLEDFTNIPATPARYECRLHSLKKAGKYTQCVETAVEGAVKSIKEGASPAFVIYGEPQSGKTEMMIALTVR
jgi:hypothetical protein